MSGSEEYQAGTLKKLIKSKMAAKLVEEYAKAVKWGPAMFLNGFAISIRYQIRIRRCETGTLWKKIKIQDCHLTVMVIFGEGRSWKGEIGITI